MSKQEQMSKQEIVEKLISMFVKEQERHHRVNHKLISRIVEIRKTEVEDYGLDDLVKEKGLEVYSNELRTAWNFRYMTEDMRKAIDSGTMTNTDYLLMMSLGIDFKRMHNQLKIVAEFNNGKITSEDLIGEKAEKLMKRLGITSILPPRENDAWKYGRFIGMLNYQIETLQNEMELIAGYDESGDLVEKFNELDKLVFKLKKRKLRI